MLLMTIPSLKVTVKGTVFESPLAQRPSDSKIRVQVSSPASICPLVGIYSFTRVKLALVGWIPSSPIQLVLSKGFGLIGL